MSILPSQVQRLPLTLEIAWGADLSKGFLSWPWSDESDRLDAQTVTLKRGRADWGTRSQPTEAGFELQNLDGHLTPDNPSSPKWPNVARQTPCRLLLPQAVGAVSAMLMDGDLTNNASTPDHSSLDITGDIDLRYEGDIDWFRGNPFTTTGGSTLVGKYKAAGEQRSYLLWIAGGFLVVSWSSDGTNANAFSMIASRKVPFGSGRHAVRGTLRVNDGAGGRVATLYTAPTLAEPWTQLDQLVVPGTTSIHSGSAPLEVGTVTGEGTAPPSGKTYAAAVYAGLAGSDLRANPDFAAQAPGTTGFTDSAGRVWQLNGEAEITNRRVWFFGQIDEIEPVWPYGDLSGPDPVAQPGEARVSISASGVLRRLGKRNKPLRSTLYRAATRPEVAPGLIAYWPMEDGSEATSFASPIPGVGPMGFGGELRPASDTALPASEPLPNLAANQPAGFSGLVPLRQTTQWRVDMFVRIPTAQALPAETPLIEINCGGSAPRWTLSVHSGGVRLRAFDALGTQLFLDGVVPTEFFDGWTQLSLDVRQEGANIRRGVLWLSLGGNVFGFSNATLAGTMGPVSGVGNLLTAPADGISFGHIAVTTGIDEFWLGWRDGANNAYIGEKAGVRVSRLCQEEGIPVRLIGDPDATEPMGPQRPRPLLDLLQECADVDLGVLADQRDGHGIEYRTRTSLYNQTPALVLDAGANEITNPFTPALDDQSLHNDITVTRDGGSSARRTTDPEPAPAESEEAAVTVNAATDTQLDQLAAWRLHLGTWPGMRYRNLSAELTAAPRLMDLWPDLDLGDRVQVRNLPPQHPTDTVDLLVEGFAEPRSPTRWTPQLNCSPAGPWTVGVLDDNTPTTSLARLDTDGTILRDPIDETATSLVVAQTGSYLQLTGLSLSRASTPDHSSFAITDLDVRFEVTLPTAWIPSPGNSFEIVGQIGLNNLAWMISINDQGRPWLRSSTDGTTPLEVFSTVPFTPPSSLRMAGRVTRDVNNGAAGKTTTFYQAPSLAGPWTQLSQETTAGTTSIFNSTADLRIGHVGVFFPFAGRVHALDWRAGIDSTTQITSPDFTAQTTGTTSFTDPAGRTWTLNASTIPDTTPAWVTTAGQAAQFPFDIVVAGERMTVSAISGAASPQTFTVTRSINGVVKAHPAGTAVQVAEPFRLAL